MPPFMIYAGLHIPRNLRQLTNIYFLWPSKSQLDELSYRLPVCAFVYRVRDCKHPVPAIYINDNNLQVRYYI
jgi:hypothetical protein